MINVYKFMSCTFLLMICGCANAQINDDSYQFNSDEKRATIKGPRYYKFCMGNSYYIENTKPDKNESFVPAGRRISISVPFFHSDINKAYSCEPRLSFVPKEGETYILNNFTKNDKCYLEVVLIDQTTETGVALESSVGPAVCE